MAKQDSIYFGCHLDLLYDPLNDNIGQNIHYILLATWDNWSAYGSCSLSCGDGQKTRSRTCSTDGACVGDLTETIECSDGACR